MTKLGILLPFDNEKVPILELLGHVGEQKIDGVRRPDAARPILHEQI